MTEMTPDEVEKKLSSIMSRLGIMWSMRDQIIKAFRINPEKYSKPNKLYKLLVTFDFPGYKKAVFVVEEVLGLDDFTAPNLLEW